MKRRNRLIQERTRVLEEAEAIIDAAEAEERDFTDDESAQLSSANERAEQIASEIAQLDALAEQRRTAPAVATMPGDGEQPTRVSVRDLGDDDPTLGWANLGEFATAVQMAARSGGVIDDRLRAQPGDFHRETGSDEGYLVPPQFRDAIWELAFDDADLLGQVNAEPTASNSVTLYADESTPWGASGIQAYWRSEGQKMDPSRLELDARDVKLGQLYAFVLATEELLQDAPRLNARLTTQSARAIRWKASEAIMYGDGAGKPLGWMASKALVTVPKESGQDGGTVVGENISQMYSRNINPGSAVWYCNQDVLPQLIGLEINGQLVWTPPTTGITGAPGGFLMGRPIRFVDHAETVGTVGDIQFVDPNGYYATRRTDGIQGASSMHLFFDYAIQSFRWTFRFGGQPFLSKPVTPAKGSNTRSHFVALATRS